MAKYGWKCFIIIQHDTCIHVKMKQHLYYIIKIIIFHSIKVNHMAKFYYRITGKINIKVMY